jgi:hypothetical protein
VPELRKFRRKVRETELFAQPLKPGEVCVRNFDLFSLQSGDKLPEIRESDRGFDPVRSSGQRHILLKQAAFVDRLENRNFCHMINPIIL